MRTFSKRPAFSLPGGLSRLDILILALLIAVYGLHASRLGSWIMDDAGISFAYSRNLAMGHGLVSQPGRIPVEGYSNPLWVLMLVPFFWLGLFDPIITPKVVSGLLVAIGIIFLYAGARRVLASRVLAAMICGLLVVNTSFVVWTVSGLENPLYALLAILMFWLVIDGQESRKLPLHLGLLAGLAGMTRPDGIVFALILPLYWAVEALHGRREAWRDKRALLRALRQFVVPFALIIGGYEVFRILYFHDLLPNTYYAKAEGAFRPQIWAMVATLHPDYFDEITSLWESVLGRLAMPGFLAMLVSVTHFMTRRRFEAWQWSGLVVFIPGALAYTLLPKDWMGEYRFATPVIPFFYLLIVQLGLAWSQYVPVSSRLQRVVLMLALIAFLGANVGRHSRRTRNFALNPPTPFNTVVEAYANRFNEYARRLGLDSASILLPDVGGTLYYSNLTVYDLGSLTDRTIARTIHTNPYAFHDYVLGQTRPTFIVTYSSWAEFADLDADPRFRRDYLPIEESLDPILLQFNTEIYSGTYVRRDAVPDAAALERLLNPDQ